MRDAPRLVCLDTVLIDVVLTVGALPTRAGDVLASEQLITTGGGFNAMSAAARHGLGVLYAGRLGSGPFAALASATLAAEGVAAPIEHHGSLDTGICVVLVEPDGERSFVTAPGAEATLRHEDLDQLGVRGGDYVLVSGYNVMYPGNADLVLDWLATLDDDVVILFDPATRMADIPSANVRAMLERATWLLANASEARFLTGEEDVLRAANGVLAAHPTLRVVLRDGERGCVVATPAGVEVVAGFVTTVLDLNGAGDVHNGVFIAELAHGASPRDAARWANAAAAMAIAVLGPATCPPRTAVAAFIDGRVR